MTRKALGTCDKDNLVVRNSWRSRAGLAKESPWGHLWIEWNLHDKTKTFEDASKLEIELASDLIRNALHAGLQNATRPVAGPMILSSPVSTQHIMNHQSVTLPGPWTKDVAKRELSNHHSLSPQLCDHKILSNSNSDDESLASALQGVRFRSGTSSTLSGAVSQFGSTNSSLTTNESDIYGTSLENKPKSRHQHSQSFSAAALPLAQLDIKGPTPVRRRGSISIPPTMQSISGFLDNHDQSLLPLPASMISQAAAPLSANVGTEQMVKPSDSHDVKTLMLQHGIWSTTASERVSYATPSNPAYASAEGDSFSRSERSSRHASNLSVSSQQRGLTILSEDEEDVFSKDSPVRS